LNIFEALALGIIQGLTEFLPISSSAHVQIAEQLMGLGSMPKPQLTAFIATIQLGTELAVLIYFWRDITNIIKVWFGSFRTPWSKASAEAKLGWLIIVGSLPIVLIGLLFQDAIESKLRNLWVIAATLIVFGIILAISDRVGRKQRSLVQMTARDGILLGFGQALALIPGVSRSGGTISVGLFLGFSRQAAARYSFLLAIPAVFASGIYEFLKTYKDLPGDQLAATGVATVAAFAVGFSVIVALLRYLNRGSFMPFVIWRIALGVALIAALVTGALVA
jgi:undecaprenyl-diphosphatase